MHGALQPGGRSPKPLNSLSSAAQIKPTSDGVQNSGSLSSLVKSKKRERLHQGSDLSKREHLHKPDGEDSGQSRSESMLQSEIAKITDKGGLVDFEGVKKLVQLMQPVNADRSIDLSGRLMLVDVISATDRPDCLGWFVQLRGLPILDDWLQEICKRKVVDGNNSKERGKSVEDYLFALLRALDKLPVNLLALQSCNIGKSVNYLRTHKSANIQKKARSMVDTWKKRVEIEISMNDAKYVPSCVSWPAKPAPSEVSQVGNKKSGGSVDTENRNSVMQSSAAKSSQAKLGAGECIGKLLASSGSVTSIDMSIVSNSKDTICGKSVGTGNPELPLTPVKEERSSSSSQSQNNSQSCSSDHAKTVGCCKEDARSSTTGSASKSTGGASPDPKSSNGVNTVAVSGVQKETGSLKFFPMHKNSFDKPSPTRIPQERFPEVPVVDSGNNQRLIVKLPNTGRSPSRGASGSYSEDPSLGSGKSSPAAKHENCDRKLRARKEARLGAGASLNPDICHGEDGLGGCDGGNVLTACDDRPKAVEDGKKAIEVSNGTGSLLAIIRPSEKLYDSSLSSMNALVESCVKFCEASASSSPEDDVGMNLLASVAAGEILRSDNISSLASPQRALADESCSMTDAGLWHTGQDVTQLHSQTNGGAANDRKGTAVFSVEKKEEFGSVLDVSPKILEQPAEVQSLRSDVIPGEVMCDSSSKASALMNESDREVDVANNFHDNGQAVLGWDKCGSASDSKVKVGSPMPEDDKKHDDVSERVVESSTPALSEPVAGSRKVVEETMETMMQSLSEMDVSLQHGAVKNLDGSVNKGKTSPSDAVQPDYMVRKNGDAGLPPSAPSKRSHMETKDEAVDETEGGDLAAKDKTKIGLGSSFSDHNTGTEDNSVREEAFLASSYVYTSAATVQENETSASSSRSNSKIDDCDGVAEERVANGKSSASNTEPGSSVKLDFDLNEGFPCDDTSQGEVNKHAALGISSAVHLPCSLSMSVPPMSASFSTSITVAAAAKGSFVPPENPLRGKGEPGWKGSAATSAFRPAEPRRTSDIVVNANETPANGNAFGGQSRPLLDFDLNVADELVLDDVTSLSYAQVSFPESGARDRGSGVLDLDLNRVDNNPDAVPVSVSNGSRSDVSVVPRRASLAGGLAKVASNASRDFDLNNGPGIDEVGAEIALRSQPIKSSLAFPSSMTGVRLNPAEFGNFSSWFPPTNSFSAITVPSMLPGRGEQNYIAAAGSQRILATPSSSASFGLEMYRPSVLPSSPAIPFASTAPFPYPGFHFETSLPPSSSFSGASTVYGDSSTGPPLCFPAIPSQLVGPSGVITSPYSHSLIMNLPSVASSVGADNRKWGGHIDLNSGPGGNDSDRRDDRLTSAVRSHFSSTQSADEQLRAFQLPGGVATVGGIFKRKEPDGGWDSTDRFSCKQSSSR